MTKLWRIDQKEVDLIKEVVDKGFSGESIELFEKQFAKKFGINYAIAVNSGTSALHVAVSAIGVSAGDEVIVPPLTFAATGFAPMYLGAKPVFADVDHSTFNIDPDSIVKKITDKTKAIITVSLYGLPPDMDRIMAIAKEHNLKVIEDNAQCVFGKYKGKIAGTIGDISIFSFQRSKHLTTGDGGMIITNDENLAETARKFSDLGYVTLKASSGTHLVSKESLQQPNFKRHESFGYNFRLPEVCAAMGLAQLEKLDYLVAKRVAIAQLYEKAIGDCDWLIPQKVPEGVISSYWTYVLRLDSAKKNVTWKQFREVFLKEGGEPFYGAWRLTYLEPVFGKIKLSDNSMQYSSGLCPVAESIQPYLIQLKTNFENLDYAKKQADVLARTVKLLD
ncbi:MAG: DegT/DnrJ/EryC1/StrS family aminotransferase [Candidatus Omnitrophica bacterium]|nr:DegT/DnrJ/EryC1/StrS family aminotransferase [Candidatus Omnitrophota bacterium]